MPDVRFLLWDFGDTLVDEGFLWVCPSGVPDWTDAYRTLAGGPFGARWNCGTANFDELVAEMAGRLGMSKEAVLAHARRCCAEVRFYEHAWAAARARDLPQALVTVNPDVFRELVMANHPIDDVFDVVVISAEEGTESKTELCRRALTRLGCEDPARALLIDNLESNVDAWRALGGAAYRFRSDAEFGSRLAAGGWNGLAAHPQAGVTRPPSR